MRAAMTAQPRAGFLPRSVRRRADHDGPLDIGHAQTNSQPRTVRAMLELLDVRPGQRVLDVGSGSGWTTAILWARVRQAEPTRLGAPDEAPFDRILVSAMAEALPQALVAQLGVDGILVVPVDGWMLRVCRDAATPDGLTVTRHGVYRFVPLITQ